MSDVRITVDDSSFRDLQRSIRTIDREIAKELNRELRDVLRTTVIPAAQSNASWSSRIPRAIRPSVTTRQIAVRIAARAAPHGALFERGHSGRTQSDRWRHPVFGNRDNWVSQPTRPFLRPAVHDNADQAIEAASDAVTAAAHKAGFTGT